MKRAPSSREIVELRARLAEAEQTLRAIRSGEVDAVVVPGKEGPRVFTLQGPEQSYRALIESMNEGALTLTTDKVILYANQCFARMVKSPLEQVTGSSLRRFLSVDDRVLLRQLLRRVDASGAKVQLLLHARDGSQLPAQVSIRPLARDGRGRATIGMVVTDLTAARRNEQLLRALSQRVVQAQEAERGRVALELHDHITQLLCAILIRFQGLVDNLPARDGPSKSEAVELREMLRKTADEVERISRDLRPSVLDELGLIAVLRATSAEFKTRTSVPVKVTCARMSRRLSADAELTLYRILQEALKNVEEHARASQVSVCLTREGVFVELVIQDDGIGFDTARHVAGRKGKSGLGLLSMRERATYVGGTLEVKSARRRGTEIVVRIPLSSNGGGGGRSEEDGPRRGSSRRGRPRIHAAQSSLPPLNV